MGKYLFTINYIRKGELTVCEVYSDNAPEALNKVKKLMVDVPFRMVVKSVTEVATPSKPNTKEEVQNEE